ncbi:YafY family protein [Nocardia sp. CDC153]|uniref:helix-turn-helix transcriptional regulator n=1 Tax=Nocardia sp. CDC153 TaxID=3112167 RepID=UPI002DBE8CB6|nr:YafY family protein [Nocardia sp. CDC153]MEC3952048.1 YafY family protein [Nocardia sp. CDC153]
MSRPTARVLALLEILQTGGTHTVARLAERLGVDERTVRRYAEHLADLDIPVESVRGRYGGYRLAPGYRMPPLMLSDDEALAVLLGLVAARRAGWVTAPAHAADSAAAKLGRVLPKAVAARLDTLLDTVEFTGEERPASASKTEFLLLFAEAIRDHRPVAITYADRSGRRTERTVYPHGVVSHSGRWYVIGTDPAAGESRSFRVDRVEAAAMAPGTFTAPVGFDPAAHLLSTLAEAPYAHEISVRVQGDAATVRALLPPELAVVHEIDSGAAEPDSAPWVRVLIHAERLDWIPTLLAGLDRPFVIEHPAALTESVRTLARRLLAATGEAQP